jgi:hypothetical protein
MNAKVFINYRREDAAPYAGRLHDLLTAHFGEDQVFIDIDQIEPGEDFVEAINDKVGACDTAIVAIGPHWLGATDASGKRRLDDEEDFVRMEIIAALQRNIRVIPVLVGGAKMPRKQDLPEALAPLSRRNAIELSETRFHADVKRLIEAIEKSFAATEKKAEPSAIPVAPSPKPAAVRPPKPESKYLPEPSGGRKQLRKLGGTSSGNWLSLGFKVAVSVGLVALVAAAVAWFLMRQSIRPTTPAIASQQTPASVEGAPTTEPKPSAASAPAIPTAVASLPSPAPNATAEKAILEIASVPSEVKVFQNGILIGITPMRRDDFMPGDTTLVLMKEGYLPRELKVIVNSNTALNKEISLAQAAPPYEGTIRVRNKNDEPAVPVSIALAPDSKSGTMTQTGEHGNFVVKFAGVWEGAELHAVTSEIISQPAGIQWTPESFTLRFADDGKSASYERVAGGNTYVAELASQSGTKREVAAVYKGKIRKQGDSTGRGVPLTITFAPARNAGTETQGSKYGDTVVNFSGIWDGKTLHAVTSTVVLKPKNIEWKPESFALSFADDWRTVTYDCTAEGQRFIAELSAQ